MLLIFLVPALLLLVFLSYHHHKTAIIILAGLLPTYLLRFSVFGIPTNFFELAIMAVALAGLIQPAVRSRWIAAWPRLPFTFTLLTLLFILAAAISTFISPHPYTSLGILKSWIFFPILLGWLVYAGGFCALDTGHWLASRSLSEGWSLVILRALLISGVVVSIIGLFQIFALDRIRSIYSVPNSLALFLAPLLVMASWQAIQKKYVSVSPDKGRLGGVLWIAILVMAAALLATQSVSGLLAVALTLLLGIIFWAHPSVRKRSLAALILLIVLATAYLSSTGRLNYLTHPPNSISVRLQLWSISWELIKEHPVLGIGLGTFEPAYQQKLHQRFIQNQNALPEFVFRDPHNWILSFWLNTGLLGLLSFIGIHVFIVWKAVRRPGLLITDYGLLAPALALLALLLFGLTDTIYWKNDLAALHWTLVALLWIAHRRYSRRR